MRAYTGVWLSTRIWTRQRLLSR